MRVQNLTMSTLVNVIFGDNMGAVPIVVGGKVIGAIGVSGATPLQDHQAAEAGVAAVK